MMRFLLDWLGWFAVAMICLCAFLFILEVLFVVGVLVWDWAI